MALVPALEDAAAVPETPFIHLTGLAEKWEMDPAIRQGARGRGQLVQWLTPESVGVVSQNLASTNGGGLVHMGDRFWRWQLHHVQQKGWQARARFF